MSFVNREIRVPFSVSDSGGVTFTDDPVQQAVQHILAAVATNPGERVMRPFFGASTNDLLFNSNDEAVIAGVVSEMRMAVRAYVPEVEVMSIENSATLEDGLVQFLISFRLKGSQDVHTADIFVGGTVIERTFSL